MQTELCPWIERFNIRKTVIFPQIIYRPNAVPIKTPTELFMEADELTS